MTWQLMLNELPQKIELMHSQMFFGKRKVKINGEKLHRSFKFFDNGSSHDFTVQGHRYIYIYINFIFDLYIFDLYICYNFLY